MAETLPACPRREFGLARALASRRADRSGAFPSGPGFSRLYQAAACIHAAALAYALLFHAVSLPIIVMLCSGLVLTLLALKVPQLAVPPQDNPRDGVPLPSPSTDLSPPTAGSGASPSPLPFMGERIVFDPAIVPLTGLAQAAHRLRHRTPVRGQPWDELIARVSHDLRTPLNAMMGFSDVLESELLGPVGHPRYREYARHIRDCGRELLKSTEDTLAITCLLDHDPEAAVETGVDLRAIVDEAWSFHADPLGNHGFSLDADIPDGLEILIDRRPMRQILVNLFAEAVNRSDARGTVGLMATVSGDLVQIEVFLRGRPDGAAVGQASLAICLARALLELNGAALVEVDDPYATWRAVTVLTTTAQSDFFGAPVRRAEAPAHVC